MLVCESTYGNRPHEPFADTAEKLYDAVNADDRPRGEGPHPGVQPRPDPTHHPLLHRGIRDGKIPHVPVYVDSPLAADVAEVYRAHPECLSTTRRRQTLRDGAGILGGDGVTLHPRRSRTRIRISRRPGPCVIIAASGMCDAGRILHT